MASSRRFLLVGVRWNHILNRAGYARTGAIRAGRSGTVGRQETLVRSRVSRGIS